MGLQPVELEPGDLELDCGEHAASKADMFVGRASSEARSVANTEGEQQGMFEDVGVDGSESLEEVKAEDGYEARSAKPSELQAALDVHGWKPVRSLGDHQ